MKVSVFYKRLFRELLDVNCKTHAYGRGLSLRFGLQGVSDGLAERAPAATLRRLQDGGSPDNSGAAGKSHFTDFFLPPSSSPERVLLGTHVSLTPSFSLTIYPHSFPPLGVC